MEDCVGREEKAVPLLDHDHVATTISSRKGGSKATGAQTLGNILVSLMGTGALGLPYAFRVAGWLAASVGLLVAGVLSYYCMLLLVSSLSLNLNVHSCNLNFGLCRMHALQFIPNPQLSIPTPGWGLGLFTVTSFYRVEPKFM